jgi:hypothetical protein
VSFSSKGIAKFMIYQNSLFSGITCAVGWTIFFPSICVKLLKSIPKSKNLSSFHPKVVAVELAAQTVWAMIASAVTEAFYDFTMTWLAERTYVNLGLGAFIVYSSGVVVLTLMLLESKTISEDENASHMSRFWAIEMGWLMCYALWYAVAYAVALIPAGDNPRVSVFALF